MKKKEINECKERKLKRSKEARKQGKKEKKNDRSMMDHLVICPSSKPIMPSFKKSSFSRKLFRIDFVPLFRRTEFTVLCRIYNNKIIN